MTRTTIAREARQLIAADRRLTNNQLDEVLSLIEAGTDLLIEEQVRVLVDAAPPVWDESAEFSQASRPS